MFLNYLWIIASSCIFLVGIYYSFKLNFIHLNLWAMFKALSTKSNHEEGISPFITLTMAVAGRIGTGSLAGIALAVYLGGPGTIFWIWVTSILCASNAFVESLLALVYKVKDTKHIYQGGPYYYIKNGMNNNPLAKLSALIILITFLFGFMTIQVNTVSIAITNIININPIVIGIIIAVLVGTTIISGVKGIANITSKLVPFMALFFFITCSSIIIINLKDIPHVFSLIFNNIIDYKAVGLGTLAPLLIGMQKGIFSSEAGLGTGSIAAAITDTKDPKVGGLVQTFGIHLENLIIATLTAFVIILSNYQSKRIIDPNGIEITNYAFKYHLGHIGPLLVTIIIIFFGLATLFTSYYYTESSFKFLKHKVTKKDLLVLKIITLLLLIISSAISSQIIWFIVDVLVGLLAIINSYALFSLRHIVFKEYQKR